MKFKAETGDQSHVYADFDIKEYKKIQKANCVTTQSVRMSSHMGKWRGWREWEGGEDRKPAWQEEESIIGVNSDTQYAMSQIT